MLVGELAAPQVLIASSPSMTTTTMRRKRSENSDKQSNDWKISLADKKILKVYSCS